MAMRSDLFIVSTHLEMQPRGAGLPCHKSQYLLSSNVFDSSGDRKRVRSKSLGRVTQPRADPLPWLDLLQRLCESFRRDLRVVSHLSAKPVAVGQAEELA